MKSHDKIFWIRLRNLRFHAYHGVLPEEATLGQRFAVDVECAFRPPVAAWTDDLTRTVSYAAICEHVLELCEQRRFQLLESLAEAIVERLRVHFPMLECIVVRVRKPSVPIPAQLDDAEVELTWSAPEWRLP